VPVRCSGRTGTRVRAMPVACRIAATIAGVDEIVGGSPTPRRPYGAWDRPVPGRPPASVACREWSAGDSP
jgi:hypothetical protein